MKVSVKMQNKLRSQRKLFLLAWTIAKEKNQPIAKALHEAWVIQKNKSLILSYVTTPTKASRIDYTCNRNLSIAL